MRWRLRTNRPPETVRGRFDARVDDTKAQETGAGAAFSSVTMAALMPGGSTGEAGIYLDYLHYSFARCVAHELPEQAVLNSPLPRSTNSTCSTHTAFKLFLDGKTKRGYGLKAQTVQHEMETQRNTRRSELDNPMPQSPAMTSTRSQSGPRF